MAKNRPFFRFETRALDAAGNFSPPRPRIHLISSRPSSTFTGLARHEAGWPWVAIMSRSKAYRRVSCFWSACWLFSTWKRKFRRVQQSKQIMLEKRTFFSRVPHSGGTSVSSVGFFFEYFWNITLEDRVSIVIGIILRGKLVWIRVTLVLNIYQVPGAWLWYLLLYVNMLVGWFTNGGVQREDEGDMSISQYKAALITTHYLSSVKTKQTNLLRTKMNITKSRHDF